MFTITKQNICAKVIVNMGLLRMDLINPDARFIKAHTAIVANIRILAQIHLGKSHTTNTDAALTDYFTLHGWEVSV